VAKNASRGSVRGSLVVVALVAVAFLGVAAFRAGPEPTISIEADLPGIGKLTPVRVRVAEPKRGLGDVRVEFVQGERVEVLAEHSFIPNPAWQFWGPRQQEDSFDLEVGSRTLKNLKEGPATIRVVAQRAGAWLRFPSPSSRELTLEVKLRPPSLQVLSTQTYVKQGGSELVVYRIGASAVSDGVQAGDRWFPGFPMPGGDDRKRFALFGVPYDLDEVAKIRLVAVDDVGNEAEASFVDRFTSRKLGESKISVPESFLARVVPAIMAQTPEVEDRGGLLENYLEINGSLRRKNRQVLADLARQSEPKFLWAGPFMQMRNAQVMSDFAVRRSYFFDGKKVDTQDHLGFDLASVRQAELQAANDGVVALARYLGIYGNCVVIDHGYGLMSLYGHLSSIAVEEGQAVERGEVIGRTGETGLAGGDHLHFSMVLQGLPVDPREWWDDHWIQDRLGLKLGDALPSWR
jgi:murein DD-endopeptidase MepM/ murein hydrolase activator NlpD